MKSKTIILALLFGFSFFPLSALALNAPTYDSVPGWVDADTYTIHFHTELGATVTVVGGPADLQPVTDGVGNPKDGLVDVMVGLAAGQVNVFSITAGLGDKISASTTITIHQGRSAGASALRGDTTPPAAPALDTYPKDMNAGTYIFTGSSEADANITARWPDGSEAGATHANSQGIFSVDVQLQPGKTNRLNFSAEDGAGNEGSGVQAVIRVAKAMKNESPAYEEPINTNVKLQSKFTDTAGHWSEDYVKTLYTKGIIQGKTDTRFDPNGEITRAELTKIALNAFKYELPAKVEAKPFQDVAVDAWFAPYVAVAKEKGIVNGQNSRFYPNASITRAAALKILFEASKLAELKGVEVNFKDVKDKDWFHTYVASAVGHNIIAGYADGTFKPDHPITRAEVSKIVVKLIELLK